VQWRSVPTGPHGLVHLDSVFHGAKGISAYALAYVFSPEERTTTLLVGGGNSLARLWLNGRLVHQTTEPNGWAWGLYRVPVTLRAGRNVVLLQVNHLTVAHYFLLRIADNPRDRGLAAAEVGLWDEAAKALGKAIERQKDDVNLHRLYAQFLLGSGDVDG